MYMGEYNHTIDNKGRLIVPAKFREVLGDKFVVTKGMDHCLWLFDMEEWVRLEEKIQALPVTNQKARKLSRFFLAGATDCEVDKQGRILIPPKTRADAGIDKDVVLAGVLQYFEIWDKAAWQREFEDMHASFDDYEEIMTAVGVL